MPSEWPVRALAEVASEITVGYVGTMADQYIENGVPFLRSLNVRPFAIDLGDVKYISAEFHRKLRKSALQPGDVVIVRTGKPGTCAVIPEHLPEANCSDVVIVRCGNSLRPHFLCYWVNAMAEAHVSAHTVGAVQQHFNVASAKQLRLPVPSLLEQDAVLEPLRAIDQRIDNLHQTIATLESIAQTLFKSWFVDFDPVRAKAEGREPDGMDAATASLFPAEFEESAQGLTPKGWRVGTFGEFAELVKGTVSPMSRPQVTFEHYSLPAFDAGQLPIFEAGAAIKSNKTRVPAGAVLQSKLNPHIPRVWFPSRVGEAAICSTEFLPWIAKGTASPEFIYCLLNGSAFAVEVQTLVTGTSNSHQRVKSDQVAGLTAIVPPKAVIDAFTRIAQALFAKVGENRWTAMNLVHIRDNLLPRLISGKLRLPEAEAELERVVA